MEEYKFVPTEEDRKSAIEMADRYFDHTFDVSNVDCFYSGFYRGMWTERRRSVSLEAENKRLREALEKARAHVLWSCANTANIEYTAFEKMITKYPDSKPRIVEEIDAALAGKGE